MILLLVEMMNQSLGTCPNFGVHFRLTVSAGVAIIPPDEQLSAEQVYSLADKALYESKVAGRNTCRFILPGQDSLTEAEVPADF